MHNSIILSLYNRSELVASNSFMSLARSNIGPNTEIVVVNDGSTVDYSALKDVLNETFNLVWVDVDTQRDRPGTYGIGGHNNPSYVMNVGFEASCGENVAFMSSDVILPSEAFNRLLKRDLTKCVATPRVIDLDSAEIFCGLERIFPAQWFLISARENWLSEEKPADENFLKGIGFEDNDMSARIALKTGKVVIDQEVTAWHQYHDQIAYSDGSEGLGINEAYCRAKWGGIPWESNAGCISIDATVIKNSVILNVETNEKCSVQ